VGRKQDDRPRTGRAVHVLGTACGTLTVAAVVSALYPVPDPILRADRATATTQDDVLVLGEDWSAVDESEPSGGPLQIPTIGEGLREYDEQMEDLDAARRAEVPAAPVAPPSSDFPEPVAVEPPPPTDAPVVPEPPAVPPEVPTPAVTDPAAPPTDAPTVPEPPAVPPEATEAPPTPPVNGPPPATPTTPAPAPTDTTLSLGERYDHTDAAGNVDFSITLVAVDTALTCTSPASVPPENGQLIGLHVEVIAPQPPAEGVTAADFRFLGPDGVLTADVDTASAAACLAEGQPGPDSPVGGTVVLDVPTTDGTIVYRPEG
jgi:hypothetical protein